MPASVDSLNYHHLRYFWWVAREGGVGKAAQQLRVSHATISAQIHRLEEVLGEALFEKRGRGIVLTEVGQVAFAYAERIFALGRELLDTVEGQPGLGPLHLSIGIADVVPKLLVRTLLQPALTLDTPVRLACREDRPEVLLQLLAEHRIDVLLSDAPLSGSSGTRVFNHLLGESPVLAYAAPALAKRLRRGFPDSLQGAPVLLPSEHTALRKVLDAWFVTHGITPNIVGEFDDAELIYAFAADGMGVFFAPLVNEEALRRQQRVLRVCALNGVSERFYAVTIERRIKHPAVSAMCEAARVQVFSES